MTELKDIGTSFCVDIVWWYYIFFWDQAINWVPATSGRCLWELSGGGVIRDTSEGVRLGVQRTSDPSRYYKLINTPVYDPTKYWNMWFRQTTQGCGLCAALSTSWTMPPAPLQFSRHF